MSKSVKLTDAFIDSTGIVHNKQLLSDILNYSTEEVQIGKWIDGKTMYRKVISFSISAHSESISIAVATLPNITIIKAEGWMIDPGGAIRYIGTTNSNAEEASRLVFVKTGGQLLFEMSAFAADNSCYAIIEYIKD